MSKQTDRGKPELQLFYPIMLKVMTDKETKEYHRRKLYELFLKSLGIIPHLEEPTYEQKGWTLDRLKGPAWRWKRCYE